MPISIEQLTSEAPELLAQIKKEAADAAMAAERERVSEILAADGDPAVARKAIAEGTSAAEAFKLFFQAEKALRAAGLTELAAQATPPQGAEEPAPTAPANPAPADQQLAETARKLAAEKGIDIIEAQRLAFRLHPELAKAWVPRPPE
ncbi:MAG: hypothetical protein MUF10_19240 [Thermoanaerobaculaceae bacterium]|nr:hypothetical protein [Thermoanaerobaculaceae bacterium]